VISEEVVKRGLVLSERVHRLLAEESQKEPFTYAECVVALAIIILGAYAAEPDSRPLVRFVISTMLESMKAVPDASGISH